MTLFDAIFEVIDIRSFSNLWYWIGLAVIWSSASFFVLGAPNDMVIRARREGGQAQADLEHLLQINARRILSVARGVGLVGLAVFCFVVTSLLVLAAWYHVEFAQAVLFLVGPSAFVAALRLSLATIIVEQQPTDDALFSLLRRHRFVVQMVGLATIFVTAMFGMYQNLMVPHGF